jgi:hypothetical protein
MYTTTTSDGVEIYSGKSLRAAKDAARANNGWIGRAVVVAHNGERVAAYVPKAGKRGQWLS